MSRFARLGWRGQRLLLGICVIVGICRVALWVLPFRRARAIGAWLGVNRGKSVVPADLSHWLVEVSTAVRLASRAVPDSTCLVRALAAQVLLGRSGLPATVRYGVGRKADGPFCAHAWLECAGRVVIGGDEDLTRYSVLPGFA